MDMEGSMQLEQKVAWTLKNRAVEHKGHMGKGVGAHRVYMSGRKGWKDRENG